MNFNTTDVSSDVHVYIHHTGSSFQMFCFHHLFCTCGWVVGGYAMYVKSEWGECHDSHVMADMS